MTEPKWRATTYEELRDRVSRGEWPRIRATSRTEEGDPWRVQQGRLVEMRDPDLPNPDLPNRCEWMYLERADNSHVVTNTCRDAVDCNKTRTLELWTADPPPSASEPSPILRVETRSGLVSIDVRTLEGPVHVDGPHIRWLFGRTLEHVELASPEQAQAALDRIHAARVQHDDAHAEDRRHALVAEAVGKAVASELRFADLPGLIREAIERLTAAPEQPTAPELPPGYWIGDCEDGTWAIKVDGILHDGLEDDDVPTSREEAVEVAWADWWNGASQEWREFMRRVGPPVLGELLQDDAQGAES